MHPSQLLCPKHFMPKSNEIRKYILLKENKGHFYAFFYFYCIVYYYAEKILAIYIYIYIYTQYIYIYMYCLFNQPSFCGIFYLFIYVRYLSIQMCCIYLWEINGSRLISSFVRNLFKLHDKRVNNSSTSLSACLSLC